jgi:hypothetical protein
MNKEFSTVLFTIITLVSIVLISFNVQIDLNRKASMRALELCIAGNERIVKESKSNFPPALMTCRL